MVENGDDMTNGSNPSEASRTVQTPVDSTRYSLERSEAELQRLVLQDRLMGPNRNWAPGGR
jgi:hypothetical protein